MSLELFKEVEKRGHEQVVFFHYPEVGLKAIVGIHSTVLGPALGGCRMKLYPSEKEAIDDVLRLSEGMTYKNSVAGLDIGGGKACIIADHNLSAGRRELFLKFGECVRDLGGRYITAEDMGTGVKDIMTVREVCSFISGTSLEEGGGGDPSPWTAQGVFQGILASAERYYSSKDLKGKTVAIQGMGHVGVFLAELLTKAGAKLVVTDIDSRKLEAARQDFGAEVVEPGKIYDAECDIYSPCAVGQTINSDTIKRLKCKIIAGGANNQLTDDSMYKPILERKILYCPDFVINAGGVINCASELLPGGWSKSWTEAKVKNIYNTIHEVLERAERQSLFPEIVAVEIAKERIEQARQKKAEA
ncbi:MAG: Glu/Leu/Phe/Val dehydrogenase [Deltaproteobacteria bacterium]|nr:Glu/Leu/Phe/Val dehydrogenase [Deltaproteobacteria bacterium]